MTLTAVETTKPKPIDMKGVANRVTMMDAVKLTRLARASR